ncbi:MAG: alpha/beta hydrolase, partial [Verrucomicrobiales bacterium]
FLNPLGISVFVWSYRTKRGNEAELWRRPLQDSQRAIRFLRKNAGRWGLDPAKIGLLAFSAGGQVGAVQIGEIGDAYTAVDELDELSARPDFAMLIYPWNVGDNSSGKLMGAIRLGGSAPPTFLVHTDDDKSSALGAAAIYMGLKRAGVSAELHVYQNGGHGYGTREREGSVIGTWKDRAADWLRVRGLADVVAGPQKMVPDGNYLVNIEKPNGVKKLLNYQVRDGVAECVNASTQDSVGLKGKFSYVEDGVFKIHVSNARHNGTLFWKFGDDGIAQVKEVPDRGEKQFAVPVEGDTLIYPTQ